MTDAEGWIFTRLLNRSWMNDGIPRDLGEMARVTGRTRAQMERTWPKLSQRWEPSPRDPGKLVNPRQELERGIAIKTSEHNKRPGNANASRTRSVENANGAQHAQARADSDSDSSAVLVLGGSGGKFSERWKADEQYCRFVADYLGTGASLIDADFSEAYEFCWRSLDFDQKLRRITGLTRRAEEYHADPRFVPKPRKFLETEWERAPKPMAAARTNGRRSTADIIGERIAKGEKPW